MRWLENGWLNTRFKGKPMRNLLLTIVCSSKPYKVVSSYRNSGGLLADFFPGPVTWYTMSIICGSLDGRMPKFPLRGSEPAMPEFNIPQNPTEINVYN